MSGKHLTHSVHCAAMHLLTDNFLAKYQTESSFVVFTDDPSKRFEQFKAVDFVRSDENLGIKYETNEIFEDTVLLLRYNCPDKECDAACLGWPDLHRHVKNRHNKVMW